jgi:cell shape-determining protein MreD
LVGAGVTIAVLGLSALVVAVTSALARVLPLWAAALVVGFAMLAVGGLLTFIGAGEIKSGMQSVSEHALARLAHDVETIKDSAKR